MANKKRNTWKKGKETRGRKAKYNWSQIKKEFFESSYDEVKAFFEDNYGIYSGTVRDNTTGWSKEKKDMLENATNLALETLEDKLARELELDISELKRNKVILYKAIANVGKSYHSILQVISDVLSGKMGFSPEQAKQFHEARKILSTIDMKALQMAYDVTKIELKEPTSMKAYSKEDKKDEDQPINITIVNKNDTQDTDEYLDANANAKE